MRTTGRFRAASALCALTAIAAAPLLPARHAHDGLAPGGPTSATIVHAHWPAGHTASHRAFDSRAADDHTTARLLESVFAVGRLHGFDRPFITSDVVGIRPEAGVSRTPAAVSLRLNHGPPRGVLPSRAPPATRI